MSKYKPNWFLIVVIAAAILLVICLALFLGQYGLWILIEPAVAGQFGDLVGGVSGPILTLIGIYYVVQTFREQRQATADERHAEEIDGFEKRFYRMLDFHRSNVDEMSIPNAYQNQEPITGRKVFSEILNELQTAIRSIRSRPGKEETKFSTLEELTIAYYCVFFGVGSNSMQTMHSALTSAGIAIEETTLKNIRDVLIANRTTLDLYRRFGGHQLRLGHYYRHLFQTVAFVDEQDFIKNKKSYLKTLRAQLSTQEQVLLLVNSLTPIGWRWWNEGYLVNYEMVKNIPAEMLERYCGVSVRDALGIKYWEDGRFIERPEVLSKVQPIAMNAKPAS